MSNSRLLKRERGTLLMQPMYTTFSVQFAIQECPYRHKVDLGRSLIGLK